MWAGAKGAVPACLLCLPAMPAMRAHRHLPAPVGALMITVLPSVSG